MWNGNVFSDHSTELKTTKYWLTYQVRLLTESSIWTELTSVGLLLVMDDCNVFLQRRLGAALEVNKM